MPKKRHPKKAEQYADELLQEWYGNEWGKHV